MSIPSWSYLASRDGTSKALKATLSQAQCLHDISIIHARGFKTRRTGNWRYKQETRVEEGFKPELKSPIRMPNGRLRAPV